MTALGLDTSNYTTSAAVYCLSEDKLVQEKQLLPVAEGQMGLRQSDALFHHVKQLPVIVERLRASYDRPITCVGASDRPQQADGSYMPCFLAGAGAGREIAAVLRVPFYRFTHQQGHVAAALYGAGCLPWIRERFLAFHVSGGTTDALLVEPDEEEILRCHVVARSLDLKAGQLIDRVGGMLGLPFPAGPALEQLALQSEPWTSIRPTMRDGCCHLSGVQNQCEMLLAKGEAPSRVARFCLQSVEAAVSAMTAHLWEVYGRLPLIYAGGVMSNSLLKAALSERFGGRFAAPVFSADNAAGIAVLTAIKHTGQIPDGEGERP